MKISYQWLQTYFRDPLPSVEKVTEAFGLHLSEIESVEEIKSDSVFDVKILPDRAPYALSHRGFAYELSAILKLEQKSKKSVAVDEKRSLKTMVTIVNNELCKRYMVRRIQGINVEPSPEWLKDKLEVVGHRSINSIVDLLNYTMLDMGQPLHVFDADKVMGAISVRTAQTGEKMTTLDGKELTLDESMLVIADEEGVLALAGIKGGKKAEVTSETKNIIIESANFEPTSIRKTSGKVAIKNDSSKRFENGITCEFAEKGMNEVTAHIKALNTSCEIGEISDDYFKKEIPLKMEIETTFITDVLGVSVSDEEIIDILRRLEIEVENKKGLLVLTIPFERLDLNIREDIVEEVGRLYGYEKLPLKPLSKKYNYPRAEKNFYHIQKIKDILVKNEFSEVFTYSLAAKGDFEIEKSMASDKNFLRTNLTDGVSSALSMNLHNAPLLGLDQIKLFEIGSVFPKVGEHVALCIAVLNTKSFKGETVNELIRQTREVLLKEIDAKVMTLCTVDDTGGLVLLDKKQIGVINQVDGILEINLDALIALLPEIPVDAEFPHSFTNSETAYKSISQYPFALRDIAVFVPGEQSESLKNDVEMIIKKEGAALLNRFDLFDTFTKIFKDTGEVKTSYAYRLVFLSNEKTLTDEEINAVMTSITEAMNGKVGWQVR